MHAAEDDHRWRGPVPVKSVKENCNLIREGHRRRAEMAKPTSKKVLGHIGNVMLMFATMMTVVAGHVADPAREVIGHLDQAKSVFFEKKEIERPYVLELCSGEGEVTR